MTLAYVYGAAATMEHPKGPPSAQRRWAIWFSAFVQRFLLLNDAQTVTFCQGPLGVPYWKPTTLLVLRLPRLAAALFSGYDPSWKCEETLGGRGPGGEWRTTKAKEYPPRMCSIMAKEFAWYAGQIARSDQKASLDEFADISALMKPWDPFLEDDLQDAMLQDYQPLAFLAAEVGGEFTQEDPEG